MSQRRDHESTDWNSWEVVFGGREKWMCMESIESTLQDSVMG